MPFARASELDRLLVCPGSAFLPRSPDREIEAGQWGRMVHRWKATGEVVAEPDYPNHAHLFRERLELVRPDRAALWPDPTGHEIGVSLDCVTGTASTFEGSPELVDAWKAAQPDTCIVGTLDYRGEILDALWVEDLKTGRWVPEPDIHQLTFYVLVGFRTAWPTPSRAIGSIMSWRRYPRANPPERTFRRITPGELDRFEARLRRLHAVVAPLRAQVNPPGRVFLPLLNPGPVCTFCPSREHCPAAQ